MTESIGAALIVTVDFSSIPRDEFEEWYDAEYSRSVDFSYFPATERWIAADGGARSLVLHHPGDLDSSKDSGDGALHGEGLSPWLLRMPPRCKGTIYETEQITHAEKPGVERARGLLFVGLNVVPEAEAQFNSWYDEEHVPRLYALPGVLSAWRFRSVRGAQRYLVIYHLCAPEVQASSAWAEAIDTPWASEMRPRTRDRMRLVCRRYHPTSQLTAAAAHDH